MYAYDNKGGLEGWNPFDWVSKQFKSVIKPFKKIIKIKPFKQPLKFVGAVALAPLKAVLPEKVRKIKPLKQPFKAIATIAEAPMSLIPKEIVPKAIRKFKPLQFASAPLRMALAPTAAVLGLEAKALGLHKGPLKIGSDDWDQLKRIGRKVAIATGVGASAIFFPMATLATASAALPMIGGLKPPGVAAGPDGEAQYYDENGNPISKEEYDRQMAEYERQVDAQLAQQRQTQTPFGQEYADTGYQLTPEEIFNIASQYYQSAGMAPQEAATAASGVAYGGDPIPPEIQEQVVQASQARMGMGTTGIMVVGGLAIGGVILYTMMGRRK